MSDYFTENILFFLKIESYIVVLIPDMSVVMKLCRVGIVVRFISLTRSFVVPEGSMNIVLYSMILTL